MVKTKNDNLYLISAQQSLDETFVPLAKQLVEQEQDHPEFANKDFKVVPISKWDRFHKCQVEGLAFSFDNPANVPNSDNTNILSLPLRFRFIKRFKPDAQALPNAMYPAYWVEQFKAWIQEADEERDHIEMNPAVIADEYNLPVETLSDFYHLPQQVLETVV